MSVIKLQDASLQFGQHKLWQHLNLEVQPGEFVVVLGPNGSGKTSLLHVLLGTQLLSGGRVEVHDKAPGHADQCIGYIPQHKGFEPDVAIRGRDLVNLGLNGHKYGVSLRPSPLVDEAIAAVGATGFANKPLGNLSGGQQQRLRVAQALVEDPTILLCDEPLLSLDLKQQQVVSELIDKRRREHNTAVVFVTHDINPILPMVDRVLYLVGSKWKIGTPKQILNAKTLSELYGSPVEVLSIHDRIVVLGAGESLHAEAGGGHHE